MNFAQTIAAAVISLVLGFLLKDFWQWITRRRRDGAELSQINENRFNAIVETYDKTVLSLISKNEQIETLSALTFKLNRENENLITERDRLINEKALAEQENSVLRSEIAFLKMQPDNGNYE